MPVIKYDQTYPKDLKAMTPSAFNEPDNINEVPVDPGTDGAYDPAARTRTDLWPQQLINLKDVDGANWWEHAGMSLLVRRNGSPSQEGYNVEYGFPDRLNTIRYWNITGDITAAPEPFDGTQDVTLVAEFPNWLSEGRLDQIDTEIQNLWISEGTQNTRITDLEEQVVVIGGQIVSIQNTLTTVATKTNILNQNGNYTLTAADINNYVRIATNGYVVVPPGVFQVSDVVYVRQAGGSQSGVYVAAGVGVTVVPPFAQNLTLKGPGSTVALVCVGTNYFELIGQTNLT